jgi:glyoxylase-like metal-dependent hydrolase (beta-lactamase superfamily II)
MEVSRVVVGYLDTNCYIIKNNGYALVIDPGDDYELINKEIGNNIVEAILLTHHHPDHVGALKHFNVPIYDYDNIDTFKSNNFKVDYIKTPGHTDKDITYIIENILFTGDFLFKGTIGRCDFINSSKEKMIESLNKIKNFKGYKVYPGHGEVTTIDEELENNPYMNVDYF